MPASVLVLDSDEHAALHLSAELRGQGFTVERASGGLALKALLARTTADVVVFGYHFDRPDDLLACEIARTAAPGTRILATATAGPAVKFLRQWAREQGAIDLVVERPLTPGQLPDAVRELAAAAQVERDLRQRSRKLAALVPEGAMGSIDSHDSEGELFDAVVLFTDMRRSSELITQVSPREFFGLLNRSLSEQSRILRVHHGQVVKYTGDGTMAVFRGMGCSHLALRAALALAHPSLHATAAFGVGLARGLVLAGLVGDSQEAGELRQYDVIGATVHLAARLCAVAGAGQVVLPRSLLQASHLPLSASDLGSLQVRGFAESVDCVALHNHGTDDESPLLRGPALAGAGPGTDVPVRVPGAGVPRPLRAA